MKPKVLIVNGEKYWPDLMPNFEVTRKMIQHSTWAMINGRLIVADQEGAFEPDAILWRVGAIKPSKHQLTALNLISLAKVPCVNSPETLKIGFDRLTMLSVMKGLNFPVIPFNVVSNPRMAENLRMKFPFVVKAGNFHGCYGKAIVRTEESWQDLKDTLFISETYVTTEPYIPYVKDIRYLVVGERLEAMSRQGSFWKANVKTTKYRPEVINKKLETFIRQLQAHLKADILAIDVLEEENGTIHIVEYNDIPGLSGFDDSLKYDVVRILTRKLNPPPTPSI